MEITPTTPGLLFPAISLLLLAYTNRFVTLTGVIRQLGERSKQESNDLVLLQVENLRLRLKVIQWMQALGVLSFLFCTLSMFALFLSAVFTGQVLFGASLLLLSLSLLCSLYEVRISTRAIKLEIARLGHGKTGDNNSA